MKVKYLYELDSDEEYRQGMEEGEAYDDELAAAHSHIASLEESDRGKQLIIDNLSKLCNEQQEDITRLRRRIKDLESRPRLDVGTTHLHKLTSQISKLETELVAAKQNNDLLNSHLMQRVDTISRLNNELKEAEINLQVFEKQWLLYKQKSDLAVEEILKLRQQVTKLETALEWYTEKGNMDRYIATSEHHTHDGEHWFNCWMMSPVTDVARKALGRKTETEELLNGRKGIHS